MSKKPRRVETYRSDSGRYLDIALLIRDARRASPAWLLAFPSAPHATYTALRAGAHRDLRALTDGRMEFEWRSEYIEAGHRRGDVFTRFVPLGNSGSSS